MKKWAVAYTDLFENDLKIKIVKAANEKEAIEKLGLGKDLPGDLEKIKDIFLDADCLVEVKEIK